MALVLSKSSSLPISEEPTWPSTAGKSCSVCNRPIQPGNADLAYHCAESSCPNVCHLNLTCSEFAIARGEARQRELTTRIWKCHLQTSTVVTTQAGLQHHHQQQQPLQQSESTPPPSLKSLLSQGLPFTEAKDIKEKCGKWSATLQSNTVPVRCNHCKTGYQKNWSTGPKT